MKNDNKKEVKSKTTLFFFMGMAASFLGSVTAAYVFIIPAKIDTFIDKKAEEKVNLKFEKIKLPSAVLFHEEIKECHDIPEPIKDKFLRHHPSDKILNQKKIYRKCVKIEEKALLRIESNAGSFIDPMILEHYQTAPHQHRAVGILINRIFIDEIKMAGETQTAVPPLSPEFSSSCQYSVLLEPGTYKIQVEAIFYGYLANPKVSVKLTALRVEPVNFIEIAEAGDNKENRSLLELNRSIERDKDGRLKPLVAPPHGTEQGPCAQTGSAANGAGSPGSRFGSSDMTGLSRNASQFAA